MSVMCRMWSTRISLIVKINFHGALPCFLVLFVVFRLQFFHLWAILCSYCVHLAADTSHIICEDVWCVVWPKWPLATWNICWMCSCPIVRWFGSLLNSVHNKLILMVMGWRPGGLNRMLDMRSCIVCFRAHRAQRRSILLYRLGLCLIGIQLMHSFGSHLRSVRYELMEILLLR